jgi:ABC-type nickel/cobalt efflux system permease component RcnA
MRIRENRAKVIPLSQSVTMVTRLSLSTLTIILVLLTAVWWLVRMRRNNSSERAVKSSPQAAKHSDYHAVSIRFPANACYAAKALAGQRFLASTAPRLPLADCDASTCSCGFMHHDDRRSGRDRRSPFARSSVTGRTGTFEMDQRSPRDRRNGGDEDD